MTAARRPTEITEDFARQLIINRVTKQYKITTYIRVEEEDSELMNWYDAVDTVQELKDLQPKDFYQIERVEVDGD